MGDQKISHRRSCLGITLVLCFILALFGVFRTGVIPNMHISAPQTPAAKEPSKETAAKETLAQNALQSVLENVKALNRQISILVQNTAELGKFLANQTSLEKVLALLLNTTSDTSGEVPPKNWMTMAFGDGRGLGNVMFNYASLLGLGKTNNFIPIRSDDSMIAEIFEVPMEHRDLNELKNYSNANFGEAHALKYDPRMANVSQNFHGNVTLMGFFQSWKYFKNVQDELRKKHFVFRPSLKKGAQDYLHKNIPEDWRKLNYTYIGVHVRRGDVLDEDKVRFGYMVPNATYFERAIRIFSQMFLNKTIFVVCTNDKPWAEQHITARYTLFVSGNSGELDLAILASMNHSIMSIGTYGWWGSWLAGGITIYYSDSVRHGSDLFSRYRKEDFYMPEWIPVA